MTWKRGIRRQVKMPVGQRDIESDVEDELRHHLEARVAELMAAGASEEDARARAEREFGDVAAARRELSELDRRGARGERRAELLVELWQDVRFALRTLGRTPSFTLAAVGTLALAIAITTALVAVVDATLLRPLPFPGADRLVMLNGVAGPDRDVRGASYPEVRDWGAMTNSFTAVSIQDAAPYNVADAAGAEQVTGEMISPSYFSLLGIEPHIGRLLEDTDDVVGAAPVAVISHALWQRRYGSARDVLGSPIRIDGASATIVGVLPPGFRGLSMESDLWVTLPPFGPGAVTERGGRWLGALAQLAPGVTVERAQADLERATMQLEKLYPETNTERRADVVPLRDSYLTGARALDDTRTLLLTVAGAVAILLLIACVNVTNLQLVRGLGRAGEVAVRYALGAGRSRVVRQLMTEALVLALLGGIVGIVLAALATRSVLAALPPGVLPPYVDVAVDTRVVLFALLLVTAAGMLAGVLPALRSTRTGLSAELRGFDRSAGVGGRRARLQRGLVAAQVALALSLMASAGLMIRSLRAQLAIDPGFNAMNVMAGRVMLLGEEYDNPARLRFVSAVLDDVAREPDIAGVAITTDAPLRGFASASMLSLPERPDDDVRYYRHIVTPSYFDVLGIRILEGRGFSSTDRGDSPPVVVVSEAFAQRLFPAGDAVGRTILFSASDTVMIVGVAENVRQRNLTTSLFDPGEDPDVYFAFAQLPRGSFDILVRGERGLIPAERLHTAVSAADRSIPLFQVESLQAALDAQTANARFGSMLLAGLGVLALLLAAVGLYGVMAFLVQTRRREIAVRMALGAAPGDVIRMVFAQAMLVVVIGALAGVLIALAAGRLSAGLLYGVAPTDPVSLGAVTAALLAGASLAALIPARRAVRAAPQMVLRE